MTMEYTKNEVLEFVKEEDISFIFLEFVDILGSSRTVTIMPSEMERAIEYCPLHLAWHNSYCARRT